MLAITPRVLIFQKHQDSNLNDRDIPWMPRHVSQLHHVFGNAILTSADLN